MHQHKVKSQDCIPSCHQSHIKNSNCVPWTSWIKISCLGQLTVIPTQVSPSMPQYETTQALSSLAKTETDLEVCNYSHQEQSSIRLSSIRLHASTGHQDPTIEVQCAALDCPMEHHRHQYPSFPMSILNHCQQNHLRSTYFQSHQLQNIDNLRHSPQLSAILSFSHSLFFDTLGSASTPQSYWSTYTKRTNSRAPYTRGLLSLSLYHRLLHMTSLVVSMVSFF